jgi:hypothetical protein
MILMAATQLAVNDGTFSVPRWAALDLQDARVTTYSRSSHLLVLTSKPVWNEKSMSRRKKWRLRPGLSLRLRVVDRGGGECSWVVLLGKGSEGRFAWQSRSVAIPASCPVLASSSLFQQVLINIGRLRPKSYSLTAMEECFLSRSS